MKKINQSLRRPVTCEVQDCRKRVARVVGYWHEWSKRVDMKKGMVPVYRQRLFFVCRDHKGDSSREKKLGIVPVEVFDAQVMP